MTSPADRLLRAGLLLAVAGVAFQTIVHLVNLFAFDDRYYHLDLSAEHTVFSWVNAVAIFAAACGALLHAMDPATRGRWRFGLLAALLAHLSLDEFFEIHERLGEWVAGWLDLPETVGVRIWLLAYLPVLAAAALLLFWSARTAPPKPRRFQLAGLALLVAAALSEGLGIFTKLLEDEGWGKPHRMRAALEEGLELGGWIVLAAGILAAFYAQRAEPRSVNSSPSTGSKLQS